MSFVTVFHSGSSEVDIMLQNDLIPGDSQDWLHGELLMLCRLEDGQPFIPANYLLVEEAVVGPPSYPGVASNMGGHPGEILNPLMASWTQDSIGRLRHDRTPALEFGDLLEQINEWTLKINSQIRQKGLNKAATARRKMTTSHRRGSLRPWAIPMLS